MSDAFTDGFCIKLTPYFEQEQIRQIRDLLNIYSMGYTITPITTELTVADYQLPQAYFVFMAAKEQDGKMSEKSKAQYRMCLEDLLFFLKMPVEKITVNHLRMYLHDRSKNRKTGKPLSTETMNQRKSIIRSFFKWLYEEEYIEKDPSVRIKREKSNAKPREQYADTDIEQMRSACEDARERAIVDLLTSSGIRISECVGLNIADVDLDKREFSVYGKGGKWRTAYMDAKAVVSIRKYISTRNDDCEALFVSKRRPYKRITTAAVRRCLHGLTEKSGVQDIIPHRFRHTMATTAINKGMPVESVQAVLGHSEISTTMRYAHVANDKVKADHQKYMQ